MGRMVDQTGLNERLQQHTRRSGMMVGVSMALAVALSIGAFVWIFFRIDPLLTDFTGRTGAVASPVGGRATPARVAEQPPAAVATNPAAPGLPPAPTAPALTASRTATVAFVATHRLLDTMQGVELRAGPSGSASRIALLGPGTRLRSLGQEERVADVIWLRFATERGDVGWLRQIEVLPLR
jgi:hypothetical protein